MTLLNSGNPRIATAQAQVLETLAGLPDEYGAAAVLGDDQAELKAAVQAQYERNRQLAAAMTLARPKRKGRRTAGVVVGLDGKRVA